MNLPRILKDENAYYLIQDISGMPLYDKSKAIVNFCDKETKIFENEIDKAIIDIFTQNGINIPNTSKSALKVAFDILKGKGITIEINDLFKYNGEYINEEDYQFIKYTKNHFTVMLEKSRVCGTRIDTLQCGVEIVVKEIKNHG